MSPFPATYDHCIVAAFVDLGHRKLAFFLVFSERAICEYAVCQVIYGAFTYRCASSEGFSIFSDADLIFRG